jgi:hypothetical protein
MIHTSDPEHLRGFRGTHGTFLEEKTPVEDTHHSARRASPVEMEDPHDLSFSSSLPPRASMVENMALALDQFSSGFLDSSPSNYVPRSNSYDPYGGRVRGHTFSSSVSSEGDIRAPPVSQAAPRVTRRDSAKYQKNLAKLPSIFGEDEDSVRAKVYDAQRAGPSKPKVRRPTKGSANSTTSSIDLGHLAAFSGRLGPAGNRRSRSFDFGSTTRPSNTFDISSGPEIAPTPVIFAGPEAQNSPTKPSFPGQIPVRKNSTRSSKSAVARKGRSGTLGTVTIKSKPNEAMPPLPSRSGAFSDRHSPQEPTFTSKPGFFRRVFGSSKTIVHNDASLHANAQSARPSQEVNTPPSKISRAGRTSAELSANKENQQPTLNKKPSSFFRRRKKSVSNTPPPPVPLTLNADVKVSRGESSPVSSLRAFMDPYLAANQMDARRSESATGLGDVPGDTPNDDGMRTPTGHKQQGSQHDGQTLRQPPSLKIPHQDSFLADSSSTEDMTRRSPFESDSASDMDHEAKAQRAMGSLKAGSSSSVLSTGHRPRQSERQASNSSFTAIPSADGTSTSARPDLKSVNGSTSSSALEIVRNVSRSPIQPSASPVSDYRSAPSTPIPSDARKQSPVVHVVHPSVSSLPVDGSRAKALKIFNNSDDTLGQDAAAAWLGEAGPERETVRTAFMELFDFTHINILASLRRLCDRIILRGETQQMDRLLLAFAQRWCACNTSHGFKSSDVVHTICYSILLLNTDLHLADIGQKMTKNQFVRNALPTIRRVADDSSDVEPTSRSGSAAADESSRGPSTDPDSTVRLTKRPVERLNREDSGDVDPHSTGGPLIDAPFTGSERGWDAQMEAVLRSVYSSIAQEPLPLFGSTESAAVPPPKDNLLSLGTHMLKRTPSTISKAHSDVHRPRYGPDSKSLGARWVSKARSRPRLPSAPGFGSSRTSLDEQSSTWSPSMSSTWSKASLGKTLTSMSVDSFGTEATHGDYQSSIGFANALSQAIIREDQLELNPDEVGMKAAPLLEDESLELCGAPWAKEGILKHKCHLEGVDKRSKDRNWNDCFAVIERGWMRLFSFSTTAKSLRAKAKSQKAGGVVGGGNWQDNAEEVWKFMLRHAIASALPPPGYSKTRPYVWALSLPTGAVHLFSVGTPDIVKEFVSTANFWSARLSKEPMMGGVSNMEYGWSDMVVNRSLIDSSRSNTNTSGGSRPSTQLSMRSSIDQNGNVRPKMPGDRIYINEWNPPQQSMFASQLLEVDQLRALQAYVHGVEEELQRHNELRGPMQLAYSPKHINAGKAMTNWEKKSSYLLREIVKFRTYIDTLQNAQVTKERLYKLRKQEEENRQIQEDLNTLLSPN